MIPPHPPSCTQFWQQIVQRASICTRIHHPIYPQEIHTAFSYQ
ncbi:hypothetical protein RBWH47_01958 [Rhodopirellula baltica WH47]|uniref:Uncharacterized protein n=1 Tax=Rhodopirellula baltica WH47 TaxID=991778 RepID=F2AVP1_RHOBT|nr:hypothetical protein RBWH47_01958 [Rhodopirellula baltica WH47]